MRRLIDGVRTVVRDQNLGVGKHSQPQMISSYGVQRLTFVMTVCPPFALTQSVTKPAGALSSEFEPKVYNSMHIDAALESRVDEETDL